MNEVGSRQLDIQIYKALNDFPLEIISEDRFDDYMALPHYSRNINSMFELLRQLKDKMMFSKRRKFIRYLQEYVSSDYDFIIDASELIWFITPEIVSKAAYKALTGKEWE